MKDMRPIEIRRLIKEAEYMATELEYRSELVRQADAEFMSRVGEMLEEYPEIKKGIDAAISMAVEAAAAAESPIEAEPAEEGSRSMKKAFREVSKKTHPDICEVPHMNDLWIKASEAYTSGDIAAMCSICESLGIQMEIGEEEKEILASRISEAKDRISFIESTFSWNWMKEQDPAKKDALLKEFISRKIRL